MREHAFPSSLCSRGVPSEKGPGREEETGGWGWQTLETGHLW